MHAVLYTHQLEPITVVDIPLWMWDQLERGDRVRLTVDRPYRLSGPGDPIASDDFADCTVEVFAEVVRRREHRSLMLFTTSEETALLLRSVLLPGQRRDAQTRERRAYVAGILSALQGPQV